MIGTGREPLLDIREQLVGRDAQVRGHRQQVGNRPRDLAAQLLAEIRLRRADSRRQVGLRDLLPPHVEVDDLANGLIHGAR
jgi:hypothetical protein